LPSLTCFDSASASLSPSLPAISANGFSSSCLAIVDHGPFLCDGAFQSSSTRGLTHASGPTISAPVLAGADERVGVDRERRASVDRAGGAARHAGVLLHEVRRDLAAHDRHLLGVAALGVHLDEHRDRRDVLDRIEAGRLLRHAAHALEVRLDLLGDLEHVRALLDRRVVRQPDEQLVVPRRDRSDVEIDDRLRVLHLVLEDGVRGGCLGVLVDAGAAHREHECDDLQDPFVHGA
jgi:hypothetical protein